MTLAHDTNGTALLAGLDVLETLSSAAVAQSTPQLARTLRRDVDATRKAVKLLVDRGYIVPEGEPDHYRLSLKLYQLASEHCPLAFLRSTAVAPMRKLTDTFQQSCHLSVIESGRLRVVSQVEGHHPAAVSVTEGGFYPLLSTTSGQLLLAFLEPGRRHDVLEDNPDYRKMTKPQRTRLERWLEAIREAGCLKQSSQLTRGISDFAVLVGIPERQPMAALTVSCVDSVLRGAKKDPQILRRLRACARQISRAAGVR